MSKSEQQYKAKKQYKRYNVAKKSSVNLDMKGFLCSSQNREKDSIKEAYNILNEYADKLYPQPAPEDAKSDEISEDLDKEIESLKNERKADNIRFQLVDSGAKNFFFIKTSLPNPVELADSIIKDIQETRTQKTKFLVRLVPVEKICKANVNAIVAAFETIGAKHFLNAGETFCVLFNHRYNNDVSRDEVINGIAAKVGEIGTNHKVDLKTGKLAIIVEIIKGFAFLSVIPDYLKFKKYNLLSVCN